MNDSRCRLFPGRLQGLRAGWHMNDPGSDEGSQADAAVLNLVETLTNK